MASAESIGQKRRESANNYTVKFFHLMLEGCDIPTRAGSCRARQRELSDRGRDVETLVPLSQRLLRVHSSTDAPAPQCRHVHPPEGDGCLLLHLIFIPKVPATWMVHFLSGTCTHEEACATCAVLLFL